MAFLLLYVCFKEFAMLSVVRKQRLVSDVILCDVCIYIVRLRGILMC